MHTIGFGHLSCLAILTAAYALGTVSAQTPPGFKPGTSNHLTVTYGATAITPAGITVPGNELVDAPSLGLAGTHTTYVAIMMDFSILPGLYSPNETTTLTSHQGEIAPYFPPGPPPSQTHTYGVFLYNEPTNFAVPANYIPFFNNLTTSVLNRVGFNLTNFVDEAGLGAPVAADWFLVSTQNTGVSSTVVTRPMPSATVSATTISVIKTNSAGGTGSASLTSLSPSATQNSSGAMIMGVKSVLVVVGALGFAVNLL
ncbi:hypothetical protein V2W45_1513045 [Cenococcum geophilum]